MNARNVLYISIYHSISYISQRFSESKTLWSPRIFFLTGRFLPFFFVALVHRSLRKPKRVMMIEAYLGTFDWGLQYNEIMLIDLVLAAWPEKTAQVGLF